MASKREDITVLVVDNDIPTLYIVASLLRSWTYKVVTVDNGYDAMAALRKYRVYFDLVIANLHMPGMNGFELQQLIKEEFQLPVIIMSEDKRKSIIAKCLGNGATYYLLKPVSAADVKDVWQYAVAAREGKAIEVVNSAVSSTGSKKTIVDVSSNSLSSVTGPKHKRKNNKRKESEMIKEDQLYGERPPAPKKTKVNWTAYLENLFLMAITQIGLDKAVPKKILEIMDVPDLTRENVASHLQKYRIFLRRVSNLGALEGISERILKSKFAATLPSVVINEIRKRLAQTKKSGTRGTVSGTLNPSNTTIRLQASKNTSMPQVLSTQLSNAPYRVLNLENQQAPQAQSLNQVRLGGQSLLRSNHTSNYQQPIMSGCPSAPLYQPNYLYNDGSRFSAYNGSMGSYGSINAANNGLMGGNYGMNYSSPIYNYGSMEKSSLGNQNGSFNYASSIGNQLGSFGSSNLPLSSTYYPTNNSIYSGIQFNGGESINLAGMDQAGFTASASGIDSASVLSGAMNATHQLSGLGNAGHEPQCTSNSASQAQPDQFDDDLAELFLNMDNFPDEPQGGEALDPGFFDFTNQNVESPKPQGLGNMIAPPSESNMLQTNELPTLSNEDPNQLQLEGSHGFQDSDPIGMYLVEDAAPAANNSATYQDHDVDLVEAVFGTDKPN